MVTSHLKNKKILITAGPTWVPIDKVRVISNIATGKTGILLAQHLQSCGAKVTLLLGPSELPSLNKRIRLIRFKFFEELKNLITRELKIKPYDIVIHSAAVSDYRTKAGYGQKVKSGRKVWRLRLQPTPKIIELLKKINPSLFLVGFKFEPESSRRRLIAGARVLMRQTGADLVVANTIYNGSYQAYIVSPEEVRGAIGSRNKLTQRLMREIRDILCRSAN